MLTINSDAHLLMRRMHKPDPKYGPDDQDKRSVVAIEAADVAQWLNGDRDAVRQLVVRPSMEVLNAAPPASVRR